MKIRFYINTEEPTDYVQQVLDHFETVEQREFHSSFSGERIGSLRFYKDENGIYLEGRDFLTGEPYLVTEMGLPIRHVSLYDEGTTGRPQLGMYELEGAKALVDSFDKARRAGQGGMMGDETIWIDEQAWRIRVVADSLEPAVNLYRKFRKGEIEPEEAWNDLAPAIRFLTDQNTILRDALEAAEAANQNSGTAQQESVGTPA